MADKTGFAMQAGAGIATGAANTFLGQLAGQIFGKQNDERQIEQQRKLNELALRDNKEMIAFSNKEQEAMQKRMFEMTNLPAQVQLAKEAGMSISSLYGGSGAGGSTLGGSGASASVGTSTADSGSTRTGMGLQIAQQLAMQQAQTENLRANTEKTKAEAANISGVDKDSKTETLKQQQFQNQVNELIGAKRIADSYDWAADKIEIESQRANAEWEAYQAAGFKGKTFNDPTSPIAKAMSAGWEKATEELKAAKTENNIKKAELTIKQFEAGLAKEGISPSSPWYIKIVGDLMQKTGLGGILDTAKKIDQEVKSHDRGTQEKKIW